MSKFGSLANGTLSLLGEKTRISAQKPPPMGKLALMGRGDLSLMGTQGKHSAPTFHRRDVRPNLINSRHDDRDQYELAAYGYGKNHVKLLYVQRNDALHHEIREYEIDTHLRLHTQKDYLEGDNRDIIATDSQKNTVYLMAKKHGVKSPEEFAILLCAHFLYTYKHVEEVNVNVEEYPWSRHGVNGVPHSHAFIFTPTATRYCQVTQLRNESPKIRGGLKDLRLLKTTQSSFTDFIQDEYRTLPDANDRIFSTVVAACWDFSTASGVDFDRVWHTVKDCILENFAGPPDTGIYSPSVQNTLYLAEKHVLDKVQQEDMIISDGLVNSYRSVDHNKNREQMYLYFFGEREIERIYSIEMRMPNKHYFSLDLSKFPKLVQGENKEVYHPVDKPSGIIYAQLNRKVYSSKL